MIGFKQFYICESNQVRTVQTVRQIVTDHNNSPMYIMMGGTFGAGKTTFARKVFSDISTIVDYDDIAMEFTKGSENIEMIKSVSGPAFKEKNARTDGMFKTGKTFVEVTTMKNSKHVLDKLMQAKRHGFKTMVIFVSTSPAEAMRRNKERMDAGKRGVDQHKIDLFYDAYYNALNNFKAAKHSKLVDFWHEVKN